MSELPPLSYRAEYQDRALIAGYAMRTYYRRGQRASTGPFDGFQYGEIKESLNGPLPLYLLLGHYHHLIYQKRYHGRNNYRCNFRASNENNICEAYMNGIEGCIFRPST